MSAVVDACSAPPRDTPWILPWRLAFGFPCLMTVPGGACSRSSPLHVASSTQSIATDSTIALPSSEYEPVRSIGEMDAAMNFAARAIHGSRLGRVGRGACFES